MHKDPAFQIPIHVNLRRNSHPSTSPCRRPHLITRSNLYDPENNLTNIPNNVILTKLKQDLQSYLTQHQSPESDNNKLLSYNALYENGRVDLVERISEVGGIGFVRKVLGLGGMMNIRGEDMDETEEGIRRGDDDDSGFLVLGRARDVRLEKRVDVGGNGRVGVVGRDNEGSGAFEDGRMSERKEEALMSAKELKSLGGERVVVVDEKKEVIVLDIWTRVSFLLVVVFLTIGFGKAGVDMVDNGVREGCRYLGVVLCLTYGAMVFPVARMARALGKDQWVWGFLALLGGPATVRRLKNMENSSPVSE